jgi:hypothetical protein
MLRTLCAAFAASFVAAAFAQSSWSVSATIEALTEVPVEVRTDGRQPRGVLVISSGDALMEFGDGEPGVKFRIKKGQRFLMTEIHAEGGCSIKLKQREMFVGSCPWLDGFTDHEADIYKVVSGKKF